MIGKGEGEKRRGIKRSKHKVDNDTLDLALMTWYDFIGNTRVMKPSVR
jgi:hypothetical protein